MRGGKEKGVSYIA
ncbi:hypothetical protein F383_15444 [Gossypium arboreum]|uniref:Uncharacterized protein n=1 Tax=Gossypium arboreum TaxID=29729 RepID=A0A0B0NBA8_GOSAR|nr:hypothetical protein F383_15444 [Gossypium arboreum]